MRIITTAAAASIQILADDGTQVLAYSVENTKFDLDLATGIKAFSGLAHLFKQLNATHNVQSEREPEVGSHNNRRRTAALNELIDDAQRLLDASAKARDNTSEIGAAREVLNCSIGRARAYS